VPTTFKLKHKAETDKMADQDTVTQSGGNSSSKDTLRTMTERAKAAGDELKSKAGEFTGASADKLKEGASNLTDAAKEVASQAGDKLKEAASERQSAGADYVGNLAEAIRRASREFDSELPIAGEYIRRAASQVDTVADSIRTGNLNDLVSKAQSFARRQPTAFLGIAALTGFAAVRFLKSSSSENSSGYSGDSSGNSDALQGRMTGAGYRDEFRN
jgi:ElaB/YqjD/DUF883 family membrane-anchored ribosome-binding protein